MPRRRLLDALAVLTVEHPEAQPVVSRIEHVLSGLLLDLDAEQQVCPPIDGTSDAVTVTLIRKRPGSACACTILRTS